MPKKHNLADEKWRSPSIIEWETFGRVGDTEGGEAYTKTQEAAEITKWAYDSGDTNKLYVGTAKPGTGDADALWRISCVDRSSGSELYADGDVLFNNKWSERESISFS